MKNLFILLCGLTVFSSNSWAVTAKVPSKLKVSAMEIKSAGVLTANDIWNLNKNGSVSNTYNLIASQKYYFDINAYGSSAAGGFPYVKVLVNDILVSKFTVIAAPLALYRVEYVPTVSGVATLKIQFTNDAKVGSEDRNLYLESVNATLASADTTPPAVRINASPGRIIAKTTPAVFRFTIADSNSGVNASATQCIMDGVASSCVSPKTYSNLSVGNHSFILKGFDNAKNSASTKAYNFQVEAAATPVLGSFTISEVKALSTSSLQVSFSASSNATSYNLKYGTSAGVYSQNINGVSSPVTISGLSAATTYYVMISAINATSSKNANSELSGATQTAASGNVTVLYSESFEAGIIPPQFGSQFGGKLVNSRDATQNNRGSAGSLKANYPAPGEGGMFAWGSYDISSKNLNDVYIDFWAKMPNVKHGLKFLKIFGQNVNGGYANTTFGLDYTGIDNGSLYAVSYGDGTETANDSNNVILLDSTYPSWIGRSYGRASVKTPQNKAFASKEWGTSWHHFRMRVKFNSGTTAATEVPDGAYYLEIDGKVYVDAKNIFNRHYSNKPISHLNFLDWTQAGNQAFEIWYDDIKITTGGFAN